MTGSEAKIIFDSDVLEVKPLAMSYCIACLVTFHRHNSITLPTLTLSPLSVRHAMADQTPARCWGMQTLA